ncbi:putative acetone carboxylase beta-subunit [Rhodococcus sp. AW25M09]|uniref:hydantoinase/oxoprolinase family protein n=1 Tax=Rhodococcus sp. AW25M09 TaxID=1268303 RepID=UPI0002ABADE9|nr:hydantoinase/oxoprolinase family protein [Rhodococcus sp. AW25M09]CCQ13690.1 putative acetone carboxylase beta-subunit [Rhodococcus sp. AW25M09]
MEHLINIDNGGTLTDICVGSGSDFAFTKALTTPVDLSQCLFDGMTKVSSVIYGEQDLRRLLHSTQHIRYSSTQGTNALVERKGPRLGLIVDDAAIIDELRSDPSSTSLFDDMVGPRTSVISEGPDVEVLNGNLVAEINRLTTAGAERLVLAAKTKEREALFKRVVLESFPRHLLGSVPVLFSWEFASDDLRSRRIWSGIINSYLHPTVERFLYSAERRLRTYKVKNPLLIYRNDGQSSRVAKSVALKTYSSGPRGGLEGTRALAAAYELPHVLMIDVGGTTTDVGSVDNYTIATERRGRINDIPVSYELSDVQSTGVGGSSIIEVENGEIVVGPRSVGAAPGPACFGFGGKKATITDVNLLLGVLDPDTYLDGELFLDAERSRTVIRESIAEPLGLSVESALVAMASAYAAKVADAFAPFVESPETTTLAAFGGGGPMSACDAARIAGVRRVLVPRLAAVFSAFGIGFSDISQTYETNITDCTPEEIDKAVSESVSRATRDMFQEGYAIADCTLEWTALVEDAQEVAIRSPFEREMDVRSIDGSKTLLVLKAVRELPHSIVKGGFPDQKTPAVSTANRCVRTAATLVEELPIYELDQQIAGAVASGPAIVEGQFFTAQVPTGWNLEVSDSGDLILTDAV